MALARPKISVVMPAYNAGATITDAIQSILQQTLTEFEFIIVDDASTDETWTIIQDFAGRDERIVALRNETNQQICLTLNTGLSKVRAPYAARMDADDWSYPDRLEKQYQYMEAHPEVVVAGGAMDVCNQHMLVVGTRHYQKTDAEIRSKIFRYSPFCHPAVIYRMLGLSQVGGYNLALRDAEDLDLYYRLGTVGKFGNLPDRLLKYRVSPKSVSNQRARRQELLTLYARFKAVAEYGYKMKPADWTYWLGQFVSMGLIPSRWKMKLFMRLRDKR